MASAAVPHSIRRTSTEETIRRAIHLVYQQHGPDLGAFFRSLHAGQTDTVATGVQVRPHPAGKKR